MINSLNSNAAAPSASFAEAPRLEGENNVEWLKRNLPSGDVTHIVLSGARDSTGFRLRIAQSHLRHDLAPSHWSHAFLLGKVAKNAAATPIYEISLEPGAGFGFPPPTNGVQRARLERYRDVTSYPNVAVLGVPIAQSEIMKALERFQTQRAVLDAVGLILRWLAFTWGVSSTGNPLLEGLGMPSAAMLEVVFGAAGFDLTPGLESRSSCPEAIWQAAKWWHEYYERDQQQPLTCTYCVSHDLG